MPFFKDDDDYMANAFPTYNDYSKEVREADLVITVSYRDGMKIIKNRDGESNIKLDLPKVLELLLPYQENYLRPLLTGWISKLKTYRIFS